MTNSIQDERAFLDDLKSIGSSDDTVHFYGSCTDSESPDIIEASDNQETKLSEQASGVVNKANHHEEGTERPRHRSYTEAELERLQLLTTKRTRIAEWIRDVKMANQVEKPSPRADVLRRRTNLRGENNPQLSSLFFEAA